MRIVAISDTHLQHDFQIPEGDILVHSGDLTFVGSIEEMTRAARWLWAVKLDRGFKDVIVICGNHDWLGEKDPVLTRLLFEERKITYLDQQAAVVQGLRFYGAPHTPRFFDWAFNVDRGPALEKIWSRIPDDTQILVTHGPPWGRLDVVNRPLGEMDNPNYGSNFWLEKTHVGCQDLARRIQQLKDLKLHCFGHIHAAGREVSADGVTFVNASVCNEKYRAFYPPQVIDI